MNCEYTNCFWLIMDRLRYGPGWTFEILEDPCRPLLHQLPSKTMDVFLCLSHCRSITSTLKKQTKNNRYLDLAIHVPLYQPTKNQTHRKRESGTSMILRRLCSTTAKFNKTAQQPTCVSAAELRAQRRTVWMGGLGKVVRWSDFFVYLEI